MKRVNRDSRERQREESDQGSGRSRRRNGVAGESQSGEASGRRNGKREGLLALILMLHPRDRETVLSRQIKSFPAAFGVRSVTRVAAKGNGTSALNRKRFECTTTSFRRWEESRSKCMWTWLTCKIAKQILICAKVELFAEFSDKSWDTRPNFANTLQLLYDPFNRDIGILFFLG